jgi:anti-sigma factor RsiW
MPDESRSLRRRAGCDDAGPWLAAVASGEDGTPRRLGAHIATCLRCQAEVAHYRRLRRNLRSLRFDEVDPDPSLYAEVLAALDGAAVARQGAHMVLRTAAYVGGISVATAAGAAGVLVWMSRRRMSLAS